MTIIPSGFKAPAPVTSPPRFFGAASTALILAALTLAPAAPAAGAPARDNTEASRRLLLDRLAWSASTADSAAMARLGDRRWIEAQLHPTSDEALPPEVETQIAAMSDLNTPMVETLARLRRQEQAMKAISDPDQKAAAKKAYEAAMNGLERDAQTRSLLRDLYSRDQLKEQMSWFWFNRFNVYARKANIRAMVGDYEDRAIRPHALGKFRDLLEATLTHPAMLRYLDNAENAVGKINENYARELMELHTMGVGSGYTQGDVQELACILTGVGIDVNPEDPRLPPDLQGLYIRRGAFVFNPRRHDFGDKVFLGHRIRGSGFAEVEQALDLLARNPATARRVSHDIAVYFVSDAPSEALVNAMAATFRRTDGDIAEVLRTMIYSPEFAASLGKRFKDPAHYAVSAVRVTYDGQTVTNMAPLQTWLRRLGQGLYDHDTPDGYALNSAAWNGPGQMETRFEIARQIGSGRTGLLAPAAPPSPALMPASTTFSAPAAQPPRLQSAAYVLAIAPGLAPATRAALAEAASPGDWNTLFLASPEFMNR